MKKIFAILMSALMIACFMPTMAFADPDDTTTPEAKSVNIGANAITVPEGGWNKTDGNYLYYGADDYGTEAAIKYRVLKNADEKLLIDSDEILWVEKFNKTYTAKDPNANAYETSPVRNTLKNGEGLFSSKELASIASTSLEAKESYKPSGWTGNYSFFDDASDGNKSFLLSVDEADKLYADDNARMKYYYSQKGNYVWWLRSATDYGTHCAAFAYGAFGYETTDQLFGVAPASYLNTENILFTTEKSFAKAQALAAVNVATGKEWKVTLKDESKTVTAGKATLNVNDVSVPVTLSGENIDQVSVVITDGDINSANTSVLYYGKLAGVDGNVTTEQTGTFTLPDELAGGYKVYLLAEDLNTDAEAGSITDYASAPVEINPTGVASIDGVNYATLEAAISAVAANGTATITLLDNVTVEGAESETPILINTKNITLNMGNNNITLGKNKYFLVVNGSLTLNGTGTVSESVPTMAPVVVVGSPNSNAENYTNVTVGSGVTLKGYCGIKVQYIDATGWGPYAYGTNIVVNGSLIGERKSGDAKALGTGIEVNGDIKYTAGNVPTITLAEGSNVTADGCGIYAGGYAKWTLNGTVGGTEAVSMKSGDVTINKGTYTANGAYADPTDAHNDGAEPTGAALSMTSNSDYANKIIMTINGGTFTSANGHAVYEGITKGSESFATIAINGGSFSGADGKAAIKVTGTKVIKAGTFSTKPDQTYVADNKCVYQNEGETAWTVGEHAWKTEKTVDKAATCTEAGSKSTHCSKCDATKDNETIEKTSEHTWADPTYTWSANGQTCTATRVCTVNSEHTNVETATVTSKIKTAAACETKGTTTYTATFSDSALKTQTKDIEDIPASGHKPEKVEGKAATCTATGLTEGEKCSVCGKVTKDQSEIEAIGHKIVKVEGQSSTTSADGWKDYYKCEHEGCTTLWSDAEGKNEITNLDQWKAGDGKIAKKTSSGGGSSSSTTTDNVTNKTEDKTATTTATVKNTTTTAADGTKTTTATVDNTTATKIVEKAVENKSEEVVVNAATKAAVTETAAGTKTEVAIPAASVSQVAEKTEAAVIIKADAAEVKLDKEAVAAVAEAAGTTGEVKLVVETIAQDANKVQVELELETANGTVSDFKGGNVSVTVKLGAALAAKDVVCVYIDDNGVYHKVAGTKNADGTYTFITGHFSSYAVMATEDADKVIAEQNAKAEDLTKALKLTARSAKTAKGYIKVTLNADEDAIKAIEDLGYTVKYKFYRSTKKAASYKAKYEKAGKTYTNTSGTKGIKYYYKARVMVYDAEGTLVAKSALTQCKYACRVK